MFCIALVKLKGKFILLFCNGFSCRHCEGTRTCLQLLLDKEQFLWQEEFGWYALFVCYMYHH